MDLETEQKRNNCLQFEGTPPRTPTDEAESDFYRLDSETVEISEKQDAELAPAEQ